MAKDFAFHPKTTNPDKWEVIKREAEKAGRDPYEDLKSLVLEERSNRFNFRLKNNRPK